MVFILLLGKAIITFQYGFRNLLNELWYSSPETNMHGLRVLFARIVDSSMKLVVSIDASFKVKELS